MFADVLTSSKLFEPVGSACNRLINAKNAPASTGNRIIVVVASLLKSKLALVGS